MVKWALQLGDAALIEGVMRTTDPSERSKLPDHHLRARKTYLITSADSPAWCSSTAISRHFLNVERVQYAPMAPAILPFQAAATTANSPPRTSVDERYFPVVASFLMAASSAITSSTRRR